MGSIASVKDKKKIYVKCDETYANVLNEFNFKNDTDIYYNSIDNEAIITIPKENACHWSHLTAFTTAYATINTLEQLMVMNPNSVFRVVADGIYFWRSYEIVDGEYKDIENFEEIIQELPVMLDMEFQEPFQYKNIFIEDRKIRLGSNNGFESNYFSTQNQSFIEGISADGCTDEKYTHSMKNLYLGIGGSGKTYNLLTDQGYINMYYLAPTRKLRTYTKHKYGEYKNIIGFYTIAKALGKDQKTLNRIKTYAKNIVIDEASMLNEKDKLDLMKTFEGIKLHFLGDIGYQLNPIDGNPMNLSNFDNIYEYKTSIRIKDEKLRSIINQIRDVQKTKNKNIRNIFPVILK